MKRIRVHLLGSRGIEAMITIDHARGDQAVLKWLLYDGHGNLVRMMTPDYALSGWQWRGVWGEVQGSLALGRGYCANLGHPEDEIGLVYMRARYYEPATGRFINEDPARDGVNWYLYADGNPVTQVDSGGSITTDEAVAIFFYVQGTKFAMAALGILAITALDKKDYPKGLAEYRMIKDMLGTVMQLSNIAAFFYGLSAVGIVSSQAANWILAALPGVQLVLSYIYSNATGRALWTHASAAVALLVIQATIQLGFIISIGAETAE